MRRREWIWIWRYILGGSGLLFGGLSTPQHTAVIFASWAGIFQDTTLASCTLPHFVGGGEGSSSGSATWDESYGLLVLNLVLVRLSLGIPPPEADTVIECNPDRSVVFFWSPPRCSLFVLRVAFTGLLGSLGRVSRFLLPNP